MDNIALNHFSRPCMLILEIDLDDADLHRFISSGEVELAAWHSSQMPGSIVLGETFDEIDFR